MGEGVSFECRRAAPGKALSHRPQRSQEQCVVQHYSPSQDQVGADVAQLHGGGSKTCGVRTRDGARCCLLSCSLRARVGAGAAPEVCVCVCVYMRVRAARQGAQQGRACAWARGAAVPTPQSSAPSVSLSRTTTRNSVVVSFFLFRGSVCCLGVCVWAAPALLSESPQPPRAVSYTVQPHTPSMPAHAPPAPRVRPAALHSIGRRAARPVLRPPSAAPPTADDAPSASPLTEAGLTAYLASGCKPKEAWR